MMKAELSVPDMHCGGCMAKIERGMGQIEGVKSVRTNLSKRRVSVIWDPKKLEEDLSIELGRLGFDAVLASPHETVQQKTTRGLMLPLAVSGFAAGNVMMMSVAVWAGAGDTMRWMFHLVSGALAFLSLVVAGPVFFRPAFAALRRFRSNMEVPISVGLCLTFLVSVLQTVNNAEHAYFDAVTGLLFFLLAGRTLDQSVREKVTSAADDLQNLVQSHYALAEVGANPQSIELHKISVGTHLRIQPGERIPVDSIIREGRSDLDVSIVNGESAAIPAFPGQDVLAGSLNLTASIVVEATSDAKNSLLGQMTALIELAEASNEQPRHISDRVIAWYTPVVHIAAFATFLFWAYFTGDYYQSTLVAVSVLIITCPCALALAVPMVQVVASRKLLQSGILMKNAIALERLPLVDEVIFDKTGTLTSGQPRLRNATLILPHVLEIAVSLAGHSRHPFSRALRIAASESTEVKFAQSSIQEIAGSGIEARSESGDFYRLGRFSWAVSPENMLPQWTNAGTTISRNGQYLASFEFSDTLREDASQVISQLRKLGLKTRILSGDRTERVAEMARKLGIARFSGDQTPEAKLRVVEELGESGIETLMIGDGINDAPALSAATVSIAPSTAADIGRNKADFINLGSGLAGILDTVKIARRARTLVRQNIAISIGYNMLAIPIAMMGLITPFIAAIAMSVSSIVVSVNALRFSTNFGRFAAPNSAHSTSTVVVS